MEWLFFCTEPFMFVFILLCCSHVDSNDPTGSKTKWMRIWTYWILNTTKSSSSCGLEIEEIDKNIQNKDMLQIPKSH